MKLARLFIAAFLLSASAPVLSATVSFVLGDHTDGELYDGSASGPNGPYGLRMDDIDPPAGDGPTFSVGSNLGGSGGVVTLTWDDANLSAGATISGSLFRNDDGSFWTVNYSLTGLIDDGNGGWSATAGLGSLTEDAGPGSVDLIGKQDASGYAFIFANDGFRLGDTTGWVGRGWVEGNGTNDFLVTAAPVPVPAALWLFGSALGGLMIRRRRTAS